MSNKEATARIRINKLLEAAGWLFLVYRLELEDQARKAFAALLSADFKAVPAKYSVLIPQYVKD